MSSNGGILGAIVGGIIGYLVPGLGMLYGVSLGYAVGMMIDPATPDLPTPGVPDPQDIVMSSSVGTPVPDLIGTGMITGHLLAYGNERVEEVYDTMEGGGGKGGGGGGDKTYISGYLYYMSWAVGICAGPISALHTIFREDEVVWEGSLELPESGGEETITLDGMGSCTFYFGTDDQVANDLVAELIPNPDYNTPYRNFCYAVLDDCIMGEYTDRCPTLRFVISKLPEYDFLSNKEIIQEYDYNPIHGIWHILHNLCGLSENWLDEDSFAVSADACFLEYRGISALFISQQSAIDYIATLNMHADCVLRYGSDGKFHIKLLRDDYAVESLPVIEESVLVDDPTFKRDSWAGTINEVKVQYTELITVRKKEVWLNNCYFIDNGIHAASTTWMPSNNLLGTFVIGDYVGQVHLSIDGGNTWATAGELDGATGEVYVSYENSYLFAASGNYVYKSGNLGISWVKGTALPYSGVVRFAVKWNSAGEKYALIGEWSPRTRWLTSVDGLSWDYEWYLSLYAGYSASIEFDNDHWIGTFSEQTVLAISSDDMTTKRIPTGVFPSAGSVHYEMATDGVILTWGLGYKDTFDNDFKRNDGTLITFMRYNSIARLWLGSQHTGSGPRGIFQSKDGINWEVVDCAAGPFGTVNSVALGSGSGICINSVRGLWILER